MILGGSDTFVVSKPEFKHRSNVTHLSTTKSCCWTSNQVLLLWSNMNNSRRKPRTWARRVKVDQSIRHRKCSASCLLFEVATLDVTRNLDKWHFRPFFCGQNRSLAWLGFSNVTRPNIYFLTRHAIHSKKELFEFLVSHDPEGFLSKKKWFLEKVY